MFTSIQGVVAECIAENELTRGMIEALPAEKYAYRPHPKARTAGELAWHLVTGRRWFLEELLQWPLPDAVKLLLAKPPAAPQHMLEALDAVMNEQLGHLRAKDDFWLREEAEFFGRATTLGGILYGMLKHEVHHRGQLSVYLRATGMRVPGVYGGSADDEA
ncbi:MAG: DinB family protein [Planctomycetes bacterium]|nr:DinB family protein [Planctomycetota bacterium]